MEKLEKSEYFFLDRLKEVSYNFHRLLPGTESGSAFFILVIKLSLSTLINPTTRFSSKCSLVDRDNTSITQTMSFSSSK